MGLSHFWTRVDRFPPILCRLLAHDHGQPRSTEHISRVSGLDPVTVQVLSSTPNWKRVPIEYLRDFTFGCGIDFTDSKAMKRVETYLRGKRANDGLRRPPQFRYLKRSPLWLDYYKPLMTNYLSSLSTNENTRQSHATDHRNY